MEILKKSKYVEKLLDRLKSILDTEKLLKLMTDQWKLFKFKIQIKNLMLNGDSVIWENIK